MGPTETTQGPQSHRPDDEWVQRPMRSRLMNVPLSRGFGLVLLALSAIAWVVADAVLPKGLPLGVVALGALVGGLHALTALGLVIVYRSSRVINFAQAEFGGLAATLAILLVTREGLNFFVALVLGLVLALATGALVEAAVVRRFFRAPRLILTVATIGVAQVLTAAAGGLAAVFPANRSAGFSGLLGQGFQMPFAWRFDVSPVTFRSDALLVAVVLPLVLVGLTWFFNRTDSGIAVRGAADSLHRAELLGIPVRRLSLISWTIAAGLSGVAVMLTAAVRGFGVAGVSGPKLLMIPLAAAVIAKFENLKVAVWAAIALGIFAEAVYWNFPEASTVDALIFVVILLALLLQNRGTVRVTGDDLGAFIAIRPARKIPASLRVLPEVRAVRALLALGTGFVALILPLFLSNSWAIIFTFTAIYALIGVSLVVLTGWAGQLTFGQFALVGVGAATAGALFVHSDLDFFLCLAGAAIAGGIVAVLIGLPALRIPGLFLAPVTLAFAVAMSTYVLSAQNFPTLNPARLTRPLIVERIDLEAPKSFYYFCLLLLVAVCVLARNFRATRVGRAVVGVRDNERMAASYSISPTRMKLVAFAFSGAVAGLAGALYLLAVHSVAPDGFTPVLSQQVFAMVVVGGLSSILGGVLGAIYVFGAQHLLTGSLQIAVTGAGMLLVLLVAPGGLVELLNQWRDAALRSVARRRGIVVPHFSADGDRAEHVPTHLVGVDEDFALDDLCSGGPRWRSAWQLADQQVRRSLRWLVVRGAAAFPPEHAALALGHARHHRACLKRLRYVLPVFLALLLLQLSAAATVSAGGGFAQHLTKELTAPAFLLLVALTAGGPALLHRRLGVVAARSEALVQLATAAGTSQRRPVVSKAETTARPLLEVSNLDGGYGHLQVLFGVDLDVRPGEIFALLGTNGAGKTTTLNVLAGSAPAWRGRLVFEGEDVTGLRAIDRVRKGVVMVPAKGVFGSLTVEENLRLACWVAARDHESAFIESTRARVFQLFPVLEQRLQQKAGLLSGGEQQMLAIAQGLLCRPRLLMIDELSLGLAPIVVASILDAVRELNASGITVLVVEQSINLSTTVAGRAAFIEKGQVQFSGATTDLESSDLLGSVFGATHVSEPAQNGDRAAVRPRIPAPTEPRGSVDEAAAPALLVDGLSKRFGGVVAIDQLSFEVPSGQVLGIIGSNGAGKTTAFDLISGFLTPDTGRLVLHGIDVTKLAPSARAGLGLGRTFQDIRLMPSLTVAETLAVALERHIEVRDPVACTFGLFASTQSELRVADRVEQLLYEFGLERWRNEFTADLSTGTRRVLEIACVTAHKPALLLLDEPTSGLAQSEAEAMASVLTDVKERTGATVIIVEHDVPLVTAVSDELMCMHLGRVIARGLPQQVLSHPDVISSYLGVDDSTIQRSGLTQSAHSDSCQSLTVDDFACRQGISTTTVRRRIRDGRLVAIRDGKGWTIPSSELRTDLVGATSSGSTGQEEPT